MLDKRLLTSLDDNFIQELKNLEHIKLRFGDSSLYACDVMLRDIKESDRLNKQFKKPEVLAKIPSSTGLLNFDKLRVNIVSPNFWKQVTDEEIKNMKVPT
jgi:anaphase-promoting complex subunit 2